MQLESRELEFQQSSLRKFLITDALVSFSTETVHIYELTTLCSYS